MGVTTPLKYTFENKGDVIAAEHVLPKDFLKAAGRKGFGISPTQVIMKEGARAGARFRRSRRLPRPIDMPIVIFGDARDEVEAKFRRFARLIQDDESTPRLVVTYPDGARFYAEIHYAGGADPTYGKGGDTDSQRYVRLAVSFISPSPYWTAEDAIPYSFNFNVDTSTDNFVEDLAEMPLISSQTVGTVTIENPGDVEAWPVWTLTGPMDSFVATRSDGQQFAYVVPIDVGETITVDTVAKTVTDQLGANKYGSLGTAPKLFSIKPGTTTVGVAADNTTPDSLVAMRFNPKQELVF